MSPDFVEKWEKLLEGVEMQRIPIQFIKKLVLKLEGRKQHTINIEKLIKQGLSSDEVEEVVGRKMLSLQDQIVHIEYMLDVESIAEVVQPETDKIFNNL